MTSKMKIVFVLILGIAFYGIGGADLIAGELKPLMIKGDHNYPPYEYLNDAGQPDGFNVDIIRAVTKEMGLAITIELEPWDKVRAQLETGEIDALMGMFNTEERDRLIDFSIPHFIASYAVFVRDGSEIKSLDESHHKTIILQNGDLAHDFVVENQITDKLVIKDSAEAVLLSLAGGEADCAIVSRLQGLIILKKNNIINVKPVGSPIIQRKYCLAVTEGNSGLLAELNEGLNIIKTTGDYNRIYEKWFGVYERFESGYQKIFRYFFLIIIPLVLIIIFIFIWNYLLKKKVASKTLELSESEERYRLLVETMNEGMAIQKNQRVTYANNSFCKMLGYQREELIGQRLSLLFKEEDQQKFKKQMDLRKKGRAESYDMELLTKDGNTVYTIVSPHSMSFDGKLFNGSSAIFTDITERKCAEDELRQSRDQFQSLVANIPGIIYRCRPDLDWTMLFMSDNVEKLTGYPAGDFINSASRTFASIIHYDDTDYVDKRVNEAIEAESQWEIEYRILHKNGSIKWVYEKGICILDDDKKNKILDGFILDITSRKRAEEELKKAQKYISGIIDAMPSVLIGVDSNGLITHWNLKAGQTTGVTSKNAMGRSLAEIASGLSVEIERVFESMQTQRVHFNPKKVRLKENEILYEDVTIYPLMIKGVEGAVIRIDDVTGQVRMEEIMIQNEKMLSVGGLAAGMAHEINNPLAAMIQTSEVMKNRLTDLEMPANRRVALEKDISLEGLKAFMEERSIARMLTTIIESGRRVADIVDNMLSFTRKSDSTISHYNLNDLLDKTLELAATDYNIKIRYDFKAIEIKKEYEASLPPVPCEGAKIQQVLFNIFRNGAYSMLEGGTEKPCFAVRTHVEKERGIAVIEIEDNGQGMDEKIRKRIFEPFFTTKPVGAGTGLGLSVSYFIITENHGGEIVVESKPGKGTKFIIRLPLQGINNDI